MRMGKKIWRCSLLWVVLVLLLTACQGGLKASGVAEQWQFSSKSGWIEKSMATADGSAIQEFDLGRPGRRLYATVTLEVGAGKFTIELLDANGMMNYWVEATPGQPAMGQGFLDTGPFGKAKYRVTAEEAEDVKFRIEFTID